MKYFIIDGEISYFLKKTNEISKICYSKFGKWYDHLKGKCALKVTNTGNYYLIKFPGKKKITLDYCEALELLLVLKQEYSDTKISTLNLNKDK